MAQLGAALATATFFTDTAVGRSMICRHMFCTVYVSNSAACMWRSRVAHPGTAITEAALYTDTGLVKVDSSISLIAVELNFSRYNTVDGAIIIENR